MISVNYPDGSPEVGTQFIEVRKFMGKEYSNLYTVFRGPQDEDFCDKCKKVFNENEYNIYSDFSECCYCLDCFFRGIWKYFKLSRKDRHLIKDLSKRS